MDIEFSQQSGLGIVLLNRPAQLNSLNLEMVTTLVDKLKSWEEDQTVKAIIYLSNNSRAFCAGGDVKEVRQNIVQMKTHPSAITKVRDFFYHEYLSMYLNHTFKKPVIAWAEGITMGAGLGLFRSAQIRVLSGNCVFAMPELAIGFFPDVGSSWFLHQIPHQIGKYIGLTGIRFNAGDAIAWGVGNQFVDFDKRAALIEALTKIKWSQSGAEHRDQISKAVSQFSYKPQITPAVDSIRDTIDPIVNTTNLRDFSESIKSHAPLPHMEYIYNASPLSVAVTYELLKRSKKWDLLEAFTNEWVMAIKMSRDGDFNEGVRAILVDKDKKPKWIFSDILKIPDELIGGYFNFQMLKYDNPWQDFSSRTSQC